MAAAPLDAFLPDGLAANSSGHLSDAQRQGLRILARAEHKSELAGAVGCVVLGVVLLVAAGPASPAWFRPLIAIASFAIAAFLVFRAISGDDALTRDLRSGRVASVEGAIGKHVRERHSWRGSGARTYYLDVAGQTLEAQPSMYAAAPDAGCVRVFFLPRSHRVVNFAHNPAEVAEAEPH
jgi:hypothetical protein